MLAVSNDNKGVNIHFFFFYFIANSTVRFKDYTNDKKNYSEQEKCFVKSC